MVGDEAANPGAFSGEIDGFDLGIEAYRTQNIFDRYADYKKYIKDLNGIRVYRNGFGIRVDKDWLGLGKQWSEGGSYYVLKPNTTLGYIALDARNNINLEETTDREGFKISPYYENFFQLLVEFKKFTEDAHEFLRRGWLAFRKIHHEKLANLDKPVETEDLSREVKSSFAKAATYKKTLVESKTIPEPDNNVEERSGEAIKGVIEYLDELSGMEAISQVLADRISTLKQQIADMYATVALGLTAEALSHEIFQIADQLAGRAANLKAYLKKSAIRDSMIIAFLEHVSTSVNALRKQISHLSPSLRYVREKKEKLLMSKYQSELVKEYYKDKLSKKNIDIQIIIPNQKDFTVFLNKGKLTQVFDNLVLNSEYWLSEDIRRKRIPHGCIIMEIDKPFVRVSDNGRGIETSIESVIFEPFVTDKGREKGEERGRGLGWR